MAVQMLTAQRSVPSRRVMLVAAGALALAALVPLSQIGAPDYSGLAANQVVEMHTSRLPVASLDELTKHSDAVVLGRVVASGAVHFIQAEGQKPAALQPDARLAGLAKAKDAAGIAAAPRSDTGILTPPKGIPVTDFTVQISQVLNGSLVQGSTITVSQPGGQITLPSPKGSTAPTLVRTLVAEHDPQMVVGQEQVLFLQRSSDGTFHVTGGPDGRFSLDARRTLKPTDENTTLGASLKGQTLARLVQNVNSIKAGGTAQ
ncbi:MAG TPA: hypothetical protein VKV73_10875 [Chloroflexota bacterium]|nr:hypothetical protein [Chloroflexota bacterium]